MRTHRVLRCRGLELPIAEDALPNGLRVIAHEDRSAPVVAVYLCYHVGSAREERGKTGFAHLFEHLLFQGSEHVASDGHFRHVTGAGGTLNGNTTSDRTLYFETLPSNQVELALWLESDRMGFLLPAMTQAKLDNQRDVVRNEKRQNYELKPYAKAHERLAAALFPAGHPYAHLTIGSHEDLIAASLDDVARFFRRWYGPDNATLALGGDLAPERAFELAARWFGELPRGPAVERPRPQPVRSARERREVVEDKVQLPQLTLAWPTPESGAPDEAALAMLAMVLSASRASVLDKALTIDAVLAKNIWCASSPGEIAGRFQITAVAAPGVTLDLLEARIRELLAGLARDGVSAAMLERMKSRLEAEFVRRLDNVSNRTGALALADVLRGDAGAFAEELERGLAVTPDEVRDVLRRHVLEQPAVVLSVVPEGRPELAAGGAR